MLKEVDFSYEHLKNEDLKDVSKMFHYLANFMIDSMKDDYLKQEALMLLWQTKNITVLEKVKQIG